MNRQIGAESAGWPPGKHRRHKLSRHLPGNSSTTTRMLLGCHRAPNSIFAPGLLHFSLLYFYSISFHFYLFLFIFWNLFACWQRWQRCRSATCSQASRKKTPNRLMRPRLPNSARWGSTSDASAILMTNRQRCRGHLSAGRVPAPSSGVFSHYAS